MRSVVFSLREYCEVTALKTIILWIEEHGISNVHWRIFSSSVNTDFDFCSLEKSFVAYENVSVITVDLIRPKEVVFGFKTDMKHEQDRFVTHFLNCSEIATCKLYREGPLRVQNGAERKIVVGNVKVKCPIEEFQLGIFAKLSELPYRIIVVPRHPLLSIEMEQIAFPKGIDFRNTMGELEGLYATADIAIMGRLFCFDGLKPDDDHNPLEATVNGNAICGINNKIPEAYRWLYEKSGLLHQCATYEDVFKVLELIVRDDDIEEKLLQRRGWILQNRQKYLEPIKEVVLSSRIV